MMCGLHVPLWRICRGQAHNSLQCLPKSRYADGTSSESWRQRKIELRIWDITVSALKDLEGFSSLFSVCPEPFPEKDPGLEVLASEISLND